MKLLCTSAVLGGAMILGSNVAFAQSTPGTATSTADPGRVEQQFDRQIDIPDLQDSRPGARAVSQDAPEGAEDIIFTLNTIELEGADSYPDVNSFSVYASRIGKTVTLLDVYDIATRLTNEYRNAGYVLTQVVIPPQTIEDGNIRMRVLEKFIDRITVEGDEDQESALKLIRSYAAKIRTDRAFNVKDLEHHLLLINDLPGVTARTVLSNSPDVENALDLRIIVERNYFDALLGVDNFGTRFLGPLQFTASGAVNSLFGNNEQITGQFVVAPDTEHIELAYGALSYEQPVSSYGTIARAYVSHSDTEPGFNLEQFEVEGRSTSFGLALRHPFIRSRNENLYGRAQFDWRDVESASILEETRKDNIRALRVGGRYEFLTTVLGVGVNVIDVEVSQGLDIFGSSDEGDANLTRASGDPTFTKIHAEIQRLQRVMSGINLLVSARGQLSNNPLLSSEEFGVGGINIGRGFDPSEIIGDEGFAAKAELQWNKPIQWNLVQDYEIYGFYDFGKVYNDDATIADDDESLASVGLGLRADFMDSTEAGLAIAFPLTRDVQTQSDNDPRIYFNLSRRF